MNEIKKIFREIIPVIIGILIALFINNWNEDRKEKIYLSKILTSIEFELKETHHDIDSIMALQYALIDTLELYLEDENISLQDIMGKTNGVSIPIIRIYSWKALSNSRIELLPYNDLSTLANIEEDKELLNDKSKYLMNFLYNNIAKSGRYEKGILTSLMTDVISTESSILLGVDELSKSIKDNN